MPETIKDRWGRTLIVPTAEEAREIAAGIAADPDTYELSDDDLREMRPYTEVYGDRVPSGMSVSIPMDPDLYRALEATGPDWPQRLTRLIRDALANGKL